MADKEITTSLSGSDVDDDDDDAPESISLAAGKTNALKHSENEKETLKKLKFEKKEKERQKQRHKVSKTEEEKKALKTLPDEILNLIPDFGQDQPKRTKQRKKDRLENDGPGRTRSSDKSTEGVPHKKARQNPTKDEQCIQNEMEMVGNNSVNYTTLKQNSLALENRTKQATDFLKKHFYGNRLERSLGGCDINPKERNLCKPAVVFNRK